MTIAIILAGGSGIRMNSDIPKQFIEVADKPVLAYTLQAFERHPAIDGIVVVALLEWCPVVESYKDKYGISKLQAVVPGGPTGQLSCYNGLLSLTATLAAQDFVIIHDAIRPIVPKIIISDMLRVAKKYGNACASLPVQETLILTNDHKSGFQSLDRTQVRRVQTPQTYRFGDLLTVHEEAVVNGHTDSVYANTLMVEHGRKIYFSLGFDNNIKITTSEDLTLFKALLTMDETDLVKQ